MEKEIVDRVMQEHGDLYISHTNHDINIEPFEVENRPWAGYWYPINNISMLLDPGSPLDKVDNAFRRMGLETGVVDFENSIYGDISADQWEGHCHAWAMASAIFPEPKVNVRIGRTVFNVLDQKAILTKLAESVEYDLYGIRYRGNYETDGTYQDIRPEAFHKLVTHYLTGGVPLLVDTSANNEVWTKPVFGFKAVVRTDSNDPDIINVTAFLGVTVQWTNLPEAYRRNFRFDRDVYDQSLTNPDRDHVWNRYEYRLHLSRRTNSSGERKVVAGEWTNRSYRSHPDVLMVPRLDQAQSLNSVLNAESSRLVNWFTNNNR